MSNGQVPIQNPSIPDQVLDAESVVVGGDTVLRERIRLAGDGEFELGDVKNATPAGDAYGQVVRQVGFGGQSGTAIDSGSYTADQVQADAKNERMRGIAVILDVTTAGTGDITLEIDGIDPASGNYVPLLTGASVTSVSTTVYRVHPELAAVANSIAQDALWADYRIKVVHNNANPITYSVGYSLLA